MSGIPFLWIGWYLRPEECRRREELASQREACPDRLSGPLSTKKAKVYTIK